MKLPVTRDRLVILASLLLFMSTATAKKDPADVYLIRHGEKPTDPSDPYLSSRGLERAACIANLFEPPTYHIGKIIAQKPNKHKNPPTEQRPYDTVKPLADKLGLVIDTKCTRDDADCVATLVKGWMKDVKRGKKKGDLLICWEHKALTSLLKAMGVKNAPVYPSSHFDLIWKYNHHEIVAEASENCPGLDNTGYEGKPVYRADDLIADAETAAEETATTTESTSHEEL